MLDAIADQLIRCSIMMTPRAGGLVEYQCTLVLTGQRFIQVSAETPDQALQMALNQAAASPRPHAP